ncbi:MAG: deoxyhypusine synthase [Candidatus Binatia bacterium]|jgi:deoxyhypusine synthase|nr:deoxyhypusine synthase [Candidatus Binatia bacterium]
MAKKSQHLAGKKIDPAPIHGSISITEMVDNNFISYNAGRLREACRLFSEKILQEDVTVGLSLSGALTPAGLGISALIPLIENGFVDWIVSTGANLYHDTHFGMGLPLHRGKFNADDVALREDGIVRIYDIFFDYDILISTDEFFREIILAPEFQREMSSSEFHFLVGKYLAEREKLLGTEKKSFLATAYRCALPIFTSSPGDSSIGMNVAALALKGNKTKFDVSRDVNESAAIVLDSKRRGGKSASIILGGGSPKNFLLQTEPHIQEVLGLDEKGHDYFIQFTDARVDTGGLSGATPNEAVSWGKIDPDQLPHSVVCYLDSTVALPILAAYAMAKHPPRKPRRLFEKRESLIAGIEKEIKEKFGKVKLI